MPKNADIFLCEICDFNCCKKSNYDIHILTPKHIKANNANNSNNSNIKKDYKCNSCGLILKHLSSLSRHKKKCLLIKTSDLSFTDSSQTSINENIIIQDASANEIKVLTTLVLELVKSNNDLQKQVLDVCKNIQPSNTINNNNKTFNLQFFLNEQCKDAMNINDFVQSIKIGMADLERLGKEGYVEGISRIIIEKLKEMNIYKRPLHCSDAKRETMYIKENDVWNKDESANNEKIIEFIKAVEQKNYTSLFAYADEYPEVYKQESKRNVPYLHMVLQSNGTAEKINKVMKRIIKEVVINKDN